MVCVQVMSARPLLRPRDVFAVALGNALEFYDFLIYAFFAIQIGHAFFPAGDQYSSLMLSLATFGAGFAARPVGAYLIGAYADRVGRKPAMILAYLMMGFAIVGLALTPSYATIGIVAPVLAILARLAQGFALGGETGPNTAFIVEGAAPHQRGLMVAWQGASQNLAVVVGASVGLVLSVTMSQAALDAYGWRIAFLLGAVTVPFGLWLRRSLPETLDAAGPDVADAGESAAVRVTLRGRGRILIIGLMVFAANAIGSYVAGYMATFAQSELHLGPAAGFTAVLVPYLIGAAAILFGGWLSDRIGQRPLMIWSSFANLILVLPLFGLILSARTAIALVCVISVMAVLSGLTAGAFYTAFSESLPKRVRGRGFASIYAIAMAAFGGSTQLVVTWLIHVTGSEMAPAWYLTGANLIGFAGLLLIRETAPARIAQADLGPADFISRRDGALG
ncbi:MFS transporter [Phenylobacterium montanum]|uniref:MFS transporter n=1 Tax=Phenylobacterium montanum TaxID=2823693 RepID=A0A975G2X8_9CAUL|nr:MFS transporter [Caulobacter sp. S6]QUD89559.1 MFS transporter [Caulobacter sp. S6]